MWQRAGTSSLNREGKFMSKHNGYHLVFGGQMRSRTWGEPRALAVAKRMFTLGVRLRAPIPLHSMAAGVPWEVSLYSDTMVAGAWRWMVDGARLVYREVEA
jgi:hypothetical protein